MEKLTNSRLAVFNECPRRHQLQYVEGWRLVKQDSEALVSGTAFHWLQEQWRLNQKRGDESLPTIAAGEIIQGSAMDPYERAKVEAMFLGYVERYRREPLGFSEVECEWEAPLVHPITGEVSPYFVLGGKMDGIVFREPTRPLILEYKTSTEDISQGSPYWAKKRLDPQISLYHVGAKAKGYEVEGCVYDVTKKPGIKPKQLNKTNKVAESPEDFFARCVSVIADSPDEHYVRADIVRTEQELTDSAMDVWEQAEAYRLQREAGIAPRNPASCFKWGRACVFHSHCCGDLPVQQDSRFKKFDNQHPELSGAQEAA
jgi:hypothetical protein